MSTAIEFENISKQYRLGLVSTKTLSHDINRWWQTAILNREDPYLKIGEINDRSSKGSSDYVWALRDINFKVEQGDVLGIIGKNGAGKSTLLKLLSKVTGPTTGVIRARGRIGSLLEVGTGFHPEMTGRENIFLNGAILGMTRHEISRKIDEIVDFSGCERYIDTPVKRYSSGMMVRLGFAVAAHLDPEILVVDEVLAVGDAEFQKKAIGKMKDVSKGEGRTVLFVSHNMTSVKNLCHNGVVLKNGTIDFSGEIHDVIDYYLREQDMRSDIEVSQLQDREGSGIMRFTKISFLDISGNERDTFEVGESITVRIQFTSSPEFDMCSTSRIDMPINNMLGERITWLSSYMYFDKVDSSKLKIDFVIDKLLLAEGMYNINLWCSTNIGLADWVQNVARLKIVFHDFYKNGRTFPEKRGDKVITEYRIG